MFKSLTARAIIPIVIAITGFVSICCLLLYSYMKADLTRDAINYEHRLADTIRRSARYAMLRSDRETLRTIIDNIGAQEGIEHVRIFNKKGVIMFSRDHKELNRHIDMKSAGCVGCHQGATPAATLGAMAAARKFDNIQGRGVLAITAPIYNEESCATAVCHVHLSSQKVLGTLDIGFSTQHLEETLALMRNRMVVFTLMILLLTVGGVAAFLQRAIFLPLIEIKEFTSRVNRGKLSGKLTGISGELADLAGDVGMLAQRLEQTEQKLQALQTRRQSAQKPARQPADSLP